MNRKTLILCLSTLALLCAIVAAGVYFLYSPGNGSPKNKGTDTAPKSDYKLFSAVPSDAAMLMSFSRLSDAVSVLNDSTQIFSVLMTDATSAKHPFSNFMKYSRKASLGSLRSENAVISLHYSGTLDPLMIISAGTAPSDTSAEVRSLMNLADSAKLLHRFIDCSDIAAPESKLYKTMLLLISSSETLLTATERHLEGGMSVLDKDTFPMAAAAADGQDALFVSHDYASKLFPVYLNRPYTSHASFFGRFADWSVLSIRNNSSKKLSMAGTSVVPENDKTGFVNVYASSPAGETLFASAVPASTVFAVSVSTAKIQSYEDSYLQYLDAAGKTEKFNSVSKALSDSLGVTPRQWFERLDVKEVVRADMLTEDGTVPLLFIRPGKENKDLILKGSELNNIKEAAQVHENPYRGYVSSIMGGLFTADDSHAVYRDSWIIFGPSATLEKLGDDRLETLASAMDLSIPEKGNNMTAYFSMSGYQSQLGKIFKPALVAAARQSLMGVTDAAAVLSVSGSSLALEVTRANIASAEKSPGMAALSQDTSVVVPEGPFKVTNSGTGKTNYLSQASNGAISLKDENGKGLWGIAFQGKICGYVECIDYYANGKLQFLFASGSKLYLIDRLGRFVTSFPVDLGKEIVLGPGVYDFTGAKGYTAIVLHSDNTIGMYDLHGRLREGWQGITSEETIRTLPELVEVGTKKYWAVRTSVQTLIYPFMGGETLTKLSGDRKIRPDSEITVKDGTVSATCLDGKVRNIKL